MKEPCPGEAEVSSSYCAGPAMLHVLTKDGAEVQSLDLDEAWVTFDDAGAPLVKRGAGAVHDRQGTIIVGDFDFDGQEDFAVQVGQNGSYGGPTFAVFLASAGRPRFVRSEPLSRLTEETLGFFQVDAAKHRLGTASKSGCCFHVFEEHEVVHGAPRVVERVTEDGTGSDGFVVVTEERRVGGRWHKETRRVPEER